MAFEGLTDKLQNAFKKLSSRGKLSESDVKAAMKEVRLALLEADVNYKVVKDFIKKVTERAVGTDVLERYYPDDDSDLASIDAQNAIARAHDTLINIFRA